MASCTHEEVTSYGRGWECCACRKRVLSLVFPFTIDDFPAMTNPTTPASASVQSEQDSLIREVFLRNGFTIKDGHDDLKPYVYAAARELLALSQPAASQEAPNWEGAEEWMPLAWALCAEENGEDSCNSLVWEGGPIPEPWGERWLKYEDEAKRLITLVRKHVPSTHPGGDDSARIDHLQYSGSTVSLVLGADAVRPLRFMVGGLHKAVSDDLRAAIDIARGISPASQPTSGAAGDAVPFAYVDPLYTRVRQSGGTMTVTDRPNEVNTVPLYLATPLAQQADTQRCIDARNRLNAALHGEGAVVDDLETAVHLACLRLADKAAAQQGVPDALPPPQESSTDIDYCSGAVAGYVDGWNACRAAVLSTTPQPSQQARQPMTEDEIWHATNDGMRNAQGGIYESCVVPFARAIEAHHGIKEGQA